MELEYLEEMVRTMNEKKNAMTSYNPCVDPNPAPASPRNNAINTTGYFKTEWFFLMFLTFSCEIYFRTIRLQFQTFSSEQRSISNINEYIQATLQKFKANLKQLSSVKLTVNTTGYFINNYCLFQIYQNTFRRLDENKFQFLT